MMYLVKKGNKYLVMASDVEKIRQYCGVDAKIIFTWEEDKQDEALKSYFSGLRIDEGLIDLCVISGITKNQMREYVDQYYEHDDEILSTLLDIEVITPSDRDELSKLSEISKKKQLEVVSEYYSNNPITKTIKSR